MSAPLETLLLAFSPDGGLAPAPRALFLGAAPHPELFKWPSVLGWQPYKPLATAWENAGFIRCDALPDEKWPLVLILPGKSRDETLAWFALARDHLQPGGTLAIAMPNTAGAARFEKELTKATGEIASLQKHKCRAFHATHGPHWDEEIFAEWRALGQPRNVSGYTVQVGIFSSEHIDPGSLLLTQHLPAHLHGSVADLGAGWGFLTDAVLKRCPKIREMHLYEADARALHCARQNLAHHPQDLHFHWHDVATGLPTMHDAIIMNPPFHTGQARDVDLGRAFLTTAANSLRRGGKIFLVANRQLPYEATLQLSGLSWRKLAEDKTYKILAAEKR